MYYFSLFSPFALNTFKFQVAFFVLIALDLDNFVLTHSLLLKIDSIKKFLLFRMKCIGNRGCSLDH